MPSGIPKNGTKNKGWFKKGNIPWHKGKKNPRPYYRHSLETLAKMKKSMTGFRHSKETREKFKLIQTERFKNPQERKKISKKLKGHIPWNKGVKCPQFSGSNHWNWKGGITSEQSKIRAFIEYKLWRSSVFARDNFTCQKCGQRGKGLTAHHIQNFAQYPDLQFAINNGITFCEKCHKEFHHIFGIKNNTREQINEFFAGQLFDGN